MVRAGCLKGLYSGGSLLGIHLVRRAQAGQRRAGTVEGRSEPGGIGKAVAGDSFDASGLEKTFGKGGTRGVIGRRAEIGEKNFRARPGLTQDLVRSAA